MTDSITIPGLQVSRRLRSRILQSPLAEPRQGIMLHYDDSRRDESALAWFTDPACRNGYTWLAMDDGSLVELADPGMRTPHAGPCLVPNANSRYYGLSAATDGHTLATPEQLDAIVGACVALFLYHGWGAESVAERLVGHDEQAIWTPETTRAAGFSDARGKGLWGRLGRKVDPTGTRGDGVPVIDVEGVRRRVAEGLRDG